MGSRKKTIETEGRKPLLLIIIIIIIIVTAYYKKWLMWTFPAPNASTSLQTALAANAHLAEGQFLHEEQTLNNAKSLIYRAGNQRPKGIIIIIIIITVDTLSFGLGIWIFLLTLCEKLKSYSLYSQCESIEQFRTYV
jgi:hypothetical protein